VVYLKGAQNESIDWVVVCNGSVETMTLDYKSRNPPVDRSKRCMTDGSPVVEGHQEIDPVTGMQKGYVAQNESIALWATKECGATEHHFEVVNQPVYSGEMFVGGGYAFTNIVKLFCCRCGKVIGLLKEEHHVGG
jgi:hypothetical protein